MTPMVASTLIVIGSLPIYATLFHRYSYAGLAMASDVGILLHTVVIAWLLNRRRLVPLKGIPWSEVAKALATAVVAGLAGSAVAREIAVYGGWRADIASLVMIGIVWAAVIVVGLWLTRSSLWRDLQRGRTAAPIAEPRAVVERTEGGAQP